MCLRFKGLLCVALAVASFSVKAAPPQVLPEPNPTSLRGSALAQVSVRHPDGRLVVGGSITWVDDAPVRYLARFSADGVHDPAFVPALHSNVDDLALDSQGRTYVMQRFSRAGAEPQALVVRVLDDATGTVDGSFHFEAPAGNAISGFGLLVDEAAGALYAATAPRDVFNRYTVTRHSLETGARDPGFEVVVNGLVHDLQRSDDALLISGAFSEVAGVPRKALARVDRLTGALDLAWNPGSTSTAPGAQTVRAMRVDGTHLFVAGPFSGLGDAGSRGLARISLADGSADPAWLRLVTGSLSALAMDSQGRLLAAGGITQIDGQPRSSAVTRFNPDGSLDATYGEANDTRGATVISLHVLPDDSVLTQTYFQGNDPTRLVRFDASTGLRQPLGTAALLGLVNMRSLIPLAAGEGYVGVHSYGLIEGAATAGFVRLGADLATAPGWRSSLGDIITFVSPRAGAVDAEHAYLSGFIAEPGGRSAARRVRLADGSVDTLWRPTGLSPPTALPSTISIAVDEIGGFLYLSGSGGLTLNRFGLSDGARDTSWSPTVGSATQIATSLVHQGFLYIAGSFNTVGGQALPRLARIALGGTGAPDTSWAPSPAAAFVAALSLDVAGGWLYAGGSDSNGRIYLRRISLLSGQPDPLWAPLEGRVGSVTKLALDSQRGELVVFGDLAVGCASERLPAVRLIGDARRVDTRWKVQLDEFGSFTDGHVLPEGDVLTAGSFERINGVGRPGLAALSSGDTIFADGAGDSGGCVL